MKQLHTIQKILALCLVFSTTLAILAGCAKKEQTQAGTISDFESQAHFQVGTSEDESGEKSGFVVSEKKYDYKSANLMLLYVENQTDQNYNVTIKGKYLNENGEIIKEEAQTFEAFPAGWSNNFIFYPKMAFDSFTYELETEEYTKEKGPLMSDNDGSPLAKYIELSYEKNLIWDRGVSGWEVNGPSVDARNLIFNAEVENHHPSMRIGVEFHVILLNTQGEIYLTDYDYPIESIAGTFVDPIGGPMDGVHRCPVFIMQQDVGGDETIPENVQGVLTALFAIRLVIDYDGYMEQLYGKG